MAEFRSTVEIQFAMGTSGRFSKLADCEMETKVDKIDDVDFVLERSTAQERLHPLTVKITKDLDLRLEIISRDKDARWVRI